MKHLLLIIVAVVCIAVVAGCTDNSRLRDEIDRIADKLEEDS